MEEKAFVTHVKGIYCRQCAEVIVGTMLQTRGVLDAAIVYLRAELTVRYDPEIVTEKKIRDRLDGCGYPSCEKGAPGSNPILNALRHPLRRAPGK